MYAEERQQAIAVQAGERGRVSVADLARRFDVTPETIRRDLDVLELAGAIERVHGGAVAAKSLRLVEAAVPARETTRIVEKTRIAHAALALLATRHYHSVILDAGTTTGRLADVLSADLVKTVVTNSVTIAATLAPRGVAEVQLLGGRVRGLTEATVGSTTVDTLATIRADIVFLGTNGFTLGHGFSTPDHAEAGVKRAMVKAAAKVVVLADSEKFGSELLVRFANLNEVHMLITDNQLSVEARDALQTAGIEVVIA
ncbi:MAG: DeoR/GlpR family DNA-binding transcription regulator [Propionibacteriaceae bacterium]|nr:DeoR/GlpR transcriptional regulator [Micropruina sp.]HBX82460.1 D-beta-D-heptose 1-phosphate adenosyltransferase [Propionibacteriaceae bacterium]HBY23470.1 D-beta-D-heptose 1-phosphate adenosyltransferase [Propionibacteriaceae bacterium]